MYKNLIFIGILAASGCSTVDNPTEESYTADQYDAATGLTLKPSEKMWVSFPEIVSIYVATETCMGMTAPGPEVRFVDTTEYFAPGFNAWGYYMANGKMVVVNTNEQEGLGFPDRNSDTDTQVLKHEFIHHILYMNGVPHRDGETPAMFANCGNGVNINN